MWVYDIGLQPSNICSRHELYAVIVDLSRNDPLAAYSISGIPDRNGYYVKDWSWHKTYQDLDKVAWDLTK